MAVPVPCAVAALEVPAFATVGLKKTDPLETEVRALLAEIKQRQGYEKELVAANSACQKARLDPEPSLRHWRVGLEWRALRGSAHG